VRAREGATTTNGSAAGGGARSLEPLRSDARRNRDRLLEAAVRVLSEDPDATIEDVAAAAGLTRSTIYRRFAGREQLLRAVRARLVEETQGVFRDAVAREPDHRRCMDLMFREAVRTSFARRRIWIRLMELGDIPDAGAYQPRSAFVEWLEEGQRAGAFRDDVPVGWLVTMWMQLVNAGCLTVERNGLDPEQAAALGADAAARLLTP
jgi:AcrR family transcriptional regulator